MAKNKKEMKPFKNIGVIYARFSSHNQKEVSIDQQITACQRKAEDFNITIIDTYEDRAVSGKTDKRSSFQRLLRDAEKGRFEYLIAWKSNRIGRNMLEQLINEAKLQAYGVQILYVEESFDNTAAGRFAARNMMNVNQFYSENMAEDILRAMNDNASKCMVNGPIPYGYKRGEDGRYTINEQTAPIILEIFERIANGERIIDICNDLNDREIKTRTGKKWSLNSFRNMLVNERYRGVYKWKDTRIEDGIPRIVSDEIFYKVQEVLKMKQHIKGKHSVFGNYLLTGKLFCGYCRKPMVGYSGTSKSGTLHHYYVCQTRRLKHTCKKEHVRRDDTEKQVALAIQHYALQPDVIEWIANSTVEYNKKQAEQSKLKMLEDQLKENQKLISNVMTAIEQGIITETTKARLIELEAEQEKIKIKIIEAKANMITIPKNDIIAGLNMFRDGNINDKKYCAKLFNTFIIAIYLYDDHMKIIFNFSGKNNTVDLPFSDTDLQISDPGTSFKCSYNNSNGVPFPNAKAFGNIIVY